jgi:two-component system cell cycle sensor histidine kinase/response regulator CckA
MDTLKRYLKYFLPALLCLALFGGTVFYYILPQTESTLMKEKRQMVKELTNTVCSMLWSYDKQVKEGILSLKDAQIRAISRIASLRYGPEQKDYFWINDIHPRMVMHPYQPELNGKDLSNYADPNGVKLFVEMARVCKKSGEGWVAYSWQWKDDASRVLPKISYVHLFEPWGWVIGTGIYLQDVKDHINRLTRNLLYTGIVVFLLIALIAGYLSYRSLQADHQKEQSLAALKQSEQKFAGAFREFPGWVVISTLKDGVYLEVNDTYLELTGFTRDEIIGKSALELGTWVDLADRRRALRILDEQGYVRNLEVKRRIASGQILDMLFSCEKIMVEGQECLLSISLDITDRKKAEQVIRKHEQDMRAILDAVTETIALIDRQGTVLAANQTVSERLGISKEELIGKCIYDFFPPEVSDFRRRKWSEVFNTGKSIAFEDTRLGMTFEQTAYPIFGEDRQVEAVVTFAREVTGQKKAEEARTKLEAQLRQAHKMEAIGTLAGGIAHDFNNILGAIMGYSELAQLDTGQGKNVSRHLDQILKAAERARDLVKQILAFSRRSETDLKPVDVNQVVIRSVEMLGHTIPKMIDIQMKLAGNLDTVKADAGQLEQVIMNLAGNAKDAMPDGGKIVLETREICLDQEHGEDHLEIAPGWYVLLTVTDTGQGMDKETQSQIFDPFFTTKDIGKGTGLGLSSVYGIVKEHNGHILCYSEPGHGTTFRIYLPASRRETADTSKGQADEAWDMPGGCETLLLVDDEPALRDIARAALVKSGYQVLEADSGEEALAIYEKRSDDIDLVILDIGMPGMGGHQCLKRIMEINPEAKVIIASGYSKNGSIKSTFETGARGYVAKPFTRKELLKSVRQLLEA